MEWFVFGVLVAIASVVAFTIGKNKAPSQQKIDALEHRIVEKEAELQQYREQVNNHFEKTAHLFGKMTEDYQTLYQHMANSAQHLVGAQPFKPALGQHQTPMEQVAAFKGEDTFSNESLYHAHDYRDPQQQTVEQKVGTAPDHEAKDTTAKVIHLDKNKSDDGAPALDYAIKEKGVVNHNSLNRDNAKTSK